MGLLIGEVAELTGITAGRIRHYERIGLIQVRHSGSGYRTFRDDDVLLLLRIDLLRSIGLGLGEIRRALEEPGDVLAQHRALLVADRDRLDTLIAAVDGAISGGGIEALARTHRSSLGLVGRPARPVDPQALATFNRIFAGTEVPVPAIFGQMVFPEQLIRLLEQVARAEGADELIDRLARLTRQLLSEEADAARWVDDQLGHPLPEPVAAVLRRGIPQLERTPLLQHGVPAWADAVSPAAGRFVREVMRLGALRGALVLGVIVVTSRSPS